MASTIIKDASDFLSPTKKSPILNSRGSLNGAFLIISISESSIIPISSSLWRKEQSLIDFIR